MTIVAGFQANNGVALAADSQEVISDYAKATTKKITILHKGSEEGAHWRVAIAGAADDAAYLDLFQEELAEKLFEFEQYDCRKMLSVAKAVLHKLHKQHVWPQSEGKSPFQSLIVTQCASEPKTPKDWRPALFETKQSAIVGVTGFRSVGVGTYMAKYLEQKFLGNRLTMDCSVDHMGDVLVLMLKEIKKAVVGCDGFTSVALFYTDGRYRWMTTSEVEEVEQLSNMFERLSLNPLLALTDPSVSDEELSGRMKRASAEAEALLNKRSAFVSRRQKILEKLPCSRGEKARKIVGRFWE